MSTTDNNNDLQYVGIEDKISSIKECTSCGQNNIDIITEGIDSVTVLDDTSTTCANCGEEGNSDDMNICNKCKEVKYCNAACKKKHRKKHKKSCERRVAELHDEKLFKQPPPDGDCPICFLLLPSLITGRKYMSCCGKVICSGCVSAPVYDNQGNEVDIVKQNECAFCRIVAPISDEEIVKRLSKRVEANDAEAIAKLGGWYAMGIRGMPQDYPKALELWHRAAELGNANAYNSIGYAYSNGDGVEVDKEKAIHYYELAAMMGHVMARHNLGNNEGRLGNMDRALKHFMIAVEFGMSHSLQEIKQMYTCGYATKKDYTKALQLYQTYLGEIKSRQRDEAAAFDEDFRYY